MKFYVRASDYRDDDIYDEYYEDYYEDDEDEDEIYSAVPSRKYWYFTRHGVQPGSVPKYVNILDIVDRPEGSYFLADDVISTNDLRKYEIIERRPEDGIYCSKASKRNKYEEDIKNIFGSPSNSVANEAISNAERVIGEVADTVGDDEASKNLAKNIINLITSAIGSARGKTPQALIKAIISIGSKYEPDAMGLDELKEFITKLGKLQNSSKTGYKAMVYLMENVNGNLTTRLDRTIKFLKNEFKIVSSTEPSNYAIKSSKSPNSSANKYPKYMKVSKGRRDFSVHYNVIDNSPYADPHQMWLEFQASVSAINPYDDAEYAWAQIENGHINIIKGGKVIQQHYYFDADDMDVENSEWCDAIIEQAIDYISEINDTVESRMVHN